MARRSRCPRCGTRTSWAIRRGKRRCAGCRYEWRLGQLPLRLTRRDWGRLVQYFVLGLSSARIAELTGLERRRVLRALGCLRQRMARDVPPVFSGVVEVDETYLGGHWRNRRHRPRGSPRGRGTTLKTSVFGILCRGGHVWAEVVPDIRRQTLQTLIRRRVQPGSLLCSDTWIGYTGIAAHGYVHRLVAHAEGHYRGGPGIHINGLEGFWGYLKRRLAAKGGIRRARLPLYLAEYVWRYNHRKESLLTQRRRLLTLLCLRSSILVAGM